MSSTCVNPTKVPTVVLSRLGRFGEIPPEIALMTRDVLGMALDTVASRGGAERLVRELRFLLPEDETIVGHAITDITNLAWFLFRRAGLPNDNPIDRIGTDDLAAAFAYKHPMIIHTPVIQDVHFVASDGATEFERAFESLLMFVEGWDFVAHDLVTYRGPFSERIFVKQLKETLMAALVDDNGVYSTITQEQLNELPNVLIQQQRDTVVLKVPFGNVVLGHVPSSHHLKRG